MTSSRGVGGLRGVWAGGRLQGLRAHRQAAVCAWEPSPTAAAVSGTRLAAKARRATATSPAVGRRGIFLIRLRLRPCGGGEARLDVTRVVTRPYRKPWYDASAAPVPRVCHVESTSQPYRKDRSYQYATPVAARERNWLPKSFLSFFTSKTGKGVLAADQQAIIARAHLAVPVQVRIIATVPTTHLTHN